MNVSNKINLTNSTNLANLEKNSSIPVPAKVILTIKNKNGTTTNKTV